MKNKKSRFGTSFVLAIVALLLVACAGGGGGPVNNVTSYTLTILQPDASNGTIVADPSKTTYIAGESVAILATPAEGKSFTGWTNGASGTTNPLVVTMRRNVTIGASFATTCSVTAVSSDDARGAVSLTPNKTAYGVGESVTITATPVPGSVFVTWAGDLSGSENPRTFTVTGDMNITAAFAAEAAMVPLTVVVEPANSGAVTLASGNYPEGSSLPVDATPARGYRFAGYELVAGATVVDSSTNASASITMPSGAATLTATFEALPVIILSSSVSPAPAGTCEIEHANPAILSDSYFEGDVARVSFVANRGYAFGSFSSGAWTSSSNPANFTVGSSNATITATATAVTPLSVSAAPNEASYGSVGVTGPSAPYYPGDVLTFTATPAAGYSFSGWSGASTSANASVTITLSGDTSLTANFRRPTMTVTVAGGSGATATFSPAGTVVSSAANTFVREYVSGTSVTMTAPEVTGYTFHRWTRNGSFLSYDASITRTVNGDDAVTAEYVRNQWTVMVYLDGDNDLEPFAIADLNEMEGVDLRGSGINVVTLFDRGNYDTSNGNWQGTRLIPVRYDSNGVDGTIVSGSVASSELGLTANGNEELNMGDPANVAGFIAAAKRLAQADNYLFVFWNHGSGWRKAPAELPVKGGSAPNAAAMSALALALPGKEAPLTRVSYKSVCVDETDNDVLMTSEIGAALASKDIDVIGFDLCLTGMIEVAYEVRNCASYMIASPEVTPGDGWEYDQWLSSFKGKTTRSGLELGKSIVDTFGTRYSTTTGSVLAVYDLSRVGTVITNLKTVANDVMSYISGGSTAAVRQANAQKVYNALYNYTEDYYNANSDLNIDLGVMPAALYQNVFTSASTHSLQRTHCNTLYASITNSSTGLVAYLWKNGTTGSSGNANSTGIAIHFAHVDSTITPDGHSYAYFSDHETVSPATTQVPSFVDNVTQWCPSDTSASSSGVLGYLFYNTSLY